MRDSPVAIVGAGPTGLAAAAMLQRAGIRPLVLERDREIGSSWRRRYANLHLHTARSLSGLPGLAIERSAGKWVAKDDYADYLASYARRYRIEPDLGVAVERLDREADTWVLGTSAGERRARCVVLATGFSTAPWQPEWPGRECFERLVHSADYVDAQPYVGTDVLVVGSGNSGAEIAVDLVEGGARRVRMSIRTPPNIVRRDTLGVPSQLLGIALRRMPERVMNPLGAMLRRLTIPDLAAYGLAAPPGNGFTQYVRSGTVPILDSGFVTAVRAGRIEIVAAVERFEDGQVVLADGSRLDVDAVVAATGFRTGLEPLVGHLGVLDAKGDPLVHGAQTHPNAPRLWFAALAAQLAGLLREAGKDARRVAKAVAAEL